MNNYVSDFPEEKNPYAPVRLLFLLHVATWAGKSLRFARIINAEVTQEPLFGFQIGGEESNILTISLTVLFFEPVSRNRTLFPYKPDPMPSFLGQESKIWTFFEGLCRSSLGIRSRKEKIITTPPFFGQKIK
jgi:hypothetical protein